MMIINISIAIIVEMTITIIFIMVTTNTFIILIEGLPGVRGELSIWILKAVFFQMIGYR